ncbi:MAG TPA: hypothetical protein VMU84_13975 [Thermoanaerobaculia bacterium]|nr:hypothetical protein [Thermoanaerobaculia bacterium]
MHIMNATETTASASATSAYVVSGSELLEQDETLKEHAGEILKDALVVCSDDPGILHAVRDLVATLQTQSQQDEAIVQTLMATTGGIPDADHLEQLRRNAEMREAFLKEVPLLKSSDIARLTGSTARNASAKANRWKTQRRIFSVSVKGVDYFPAFQFDEHGEPLEAMREILEMFADFGEWEIPLWFFSNNGWLPNEDAPMTVLPRDAAAVIEAARREIEPLEF